MFMLTASCHVADVRHCRSYRGLAYLQNDDRAAAAYRGHMAVIWIKLSQKSRTAITYVVEVNSIYRSNSEILSIVEM